MYYLVMRCRRANFFYPKLFVQYNIAKKSDLLSSRVYVQLYVSSRSAQGQGQICPETEPKLTQEQTSNFFYTKIQ